MHDYIKENFDLNEINKLSTTDTESLILNAEESYHKQIDEIAKNIASNGKIKVILLAGPSSSGKTTSSNLLREELAEYGYDSIVISTDDFFLNREDTPRLPNNDYDFENVTALDLPYLNKFIDDLFDKGEAMMPVYNFVTGAREEEYKKVVLKENTLIIIEGIHALNPIVFRKHNDAMYKIYICVNSNFCIDNKIVIPAQKCRLMRRLIRDSRTRGMSLDETFKTWQNVLNGEDLFIKPFKNTADYLINSTHAYEVLMYAHALLPRLKDETDEMSKTLASMLEKCNHLNPDLLPENSLLHEFLG